jgi:PPOX class probable F420-dependent enzyme
VTVSGRGVPQPSPVWFWWDGDSLLVYSRPDTPKLRNIAANPRVALHLNDDGTGGDVVVISGRAHTSDDLPADQVPDYVAKYLGLIEGNNWTPASFAADYSVPIRITPTRVHGH